MALTIVNRSHLSDELITRAVSFVENGRDFSDTTLEIRTSQSRPYAGRAYSRTPPSSGFTTSYLVRIWIAREVALPRELHYRGYATAPFYTVQDLEELLLAVLAHEFEHIMQFRTKGRPRSEPAAEWVAAETLNRYRRARGLPEERLRTCTVHEFVVLGLVYKPVCKGGPALRHEKAVCRICGLKRCKPVTGTTGLTVPGPAIAAAYSG